MKNARVEVVVMLGLLLAGVGGIAALIVTQVGTLFFTLDDPYIHLSVAENLLRHGVYGINPAEAASPSSSILWPFLLLPIELLGLGAAGVFALNVVFAVMTVWVGLRIVRDNAEPWVALPLIVAWFLSCNLVGLVFTGMEHTLQVAVCVAIARGALLTLRGAEPPRWLWALLILAPLVRYENMAVSVPIAVWLFALGQRRNATLTFAAIGASLGAFSAALWLSGMWLLPSSVLAKSTHVKSNGVWAVVANFASNTSGWAGGVIMALGMALLGLALVRRNEASPPAFDAHGKLALAAAATTILHLAVGRNGWFHRYEAYVVAFAGIMLLGLWPARWTRKTAAFAVVALLVAGWQYTVTLRLIPLAAGNIHAQQFQLHRLAVELDAPVGVNDLGWVSYRNDAYVYDFYGLGNYDATKHRLQKSGVRWMEEAAVAAKLELVMISTVWFDDQVPASWTPVGALCVDMPQVTLKGREVRFFAVDPPTEELRAHIRRWADGLPATSHYADGRCED